MAKSKPGVLQYRCRRCHAIVDGPQVPDVETGVKIASGQMPFPPDTVTKTWPLEATLVKPFVNHDCGSEEGAYRGVIGVAELIGGEHRKANGEAKNVPDV